MGSSAPQSVPRSGVAVRAREIYCSANGDRWLLAHDPVLAGYSSGTSLIFPRAVKWPTLMSEPSSLQLAMGQRSKNFCA
jgi:hypothetical protein